MRSTLLLTVLALSSAGQFAVAGEPPAENLGLPFVQKYCLSCHDVAKKKGNLDLSRFADEASLLSSRKTWATVLDYVRNGEMPPRSAKQPTADERQAFSEAIRGVYRRADAGKPRDPGRAPAAGSTSRRTKRGGAFLTPCAKRQPASANR